VSVDGDRCLAGLRLQAVLRDGTAVCLRAIRPDDKARLQVAFAHLSPRAVYQRFFHRVNELTAEDLRRLTEVDFRDHVCMVLTVGAGSDERLVALGQYVRVVSGGDSAEVAFTVIDDYQGRGAATLLLRELVAIARGRGVRRLLALVLNDNRQMLEVFRHSKLPLQESLVDGVRSIVLTLDGAAPPEACRRRLSYNLRNAKPTQWRGFADDSTREPGYARP
jgi:GNAT superfamily N-acetyltransferase